MAWSPRTPAVRRPHCAAAVVILTLFEGQKTSPLPPRGENGESRVVQEPLDFAAFAETIALIGLLLADNQRAATGGSCPALKSKSGGLGICCLQFAGLPTVCPP